MPATEAGGHGHGHGHTHKTEFTPRPYTPALPQHQCPTHIDISGRSRSDRSVSGRGGGRGGEGEAAAATWAGSSIRQARPYVPVTGPADPVEVLRALTHQLQQIQHVQNFASQQSQSQSMGMGNVVGLDTGVSTGLGLSIHQQQPLPPPSVASSTSQHHQQQQQQQPLLHRSAGWQRPEHEHEHGQNILLRQGLDRAAVELLAWQEMLQHKEAQLHMQVALVCVPVICARTRVCVCVCVLRRELRQ